MVVSHRPRVTDKGIRYMEGCRGEGGVLIHKKGDDPYM